MGKDSPCLFQDSACLSRYLGLVEQKCLFQGDRKTSIRRWWERHAKQRELKDKPQEYFKTELPTLSMKIRVICGACKGGEKGLQVVHMLAIMFAVA